MVIVTNDTDVNIAPALRLIRQHTQVRIGVFVPSINTRQANTDLVKLAHWSLEHMIAAELLDYQLPRIIQGRKVTTKPESWYAQPHLLQQILALAIPVRGNKASVFKWMERANPHLGNEKPIEMRPKQGSPSARLHPAVDRAPTVTL